MAVVPITREFLRNFYKDFPLEPPSSRLAALRLAMEEKGEAYFAAWDETSKALRIDEPPAKIDHNLWKNREYLEEMAEQLQTLPEPLVGLQSLAQSLEAVATTRNLIEKFQREQTERVAAMVNDYLPKDFRGDIVRDQKAKSEEKRKAELNDLLERGGSIKEKYELLWRQQMDRRQKLAALGESSATFRWCLVYLGGVPEHLLDFVKKINDHDGPMAEQRLTYGPFVFELTAFVSVLRIFVSAWTADVRNAAAAAQPGDVVEALSALVEEAAQLYAAEMARFIAFISDLFEKSPFFITAEEASAAGADMQTISLRAGTVHEYFVQVDGEGHTVAWDVKVEGGDVKFSVDFQTEEEEGKAMPMIPATMITTNQGHFVAAARGKCKMVFDNTHTMWYTKTVKFKAAAESQDTDDAPEGEEKPEGG